MIILTEWDTSVIIENHLKGNSFYSDLDEKLKNKIIDGVCDYVMELDIPSNILFEKLEYDTDFLKEFL